MAFGWLGMHLDVIGSVTTLAGSALTLFSSIPEKKHKGLAIMGGIVALLGGTLTFIASQSSSHSQAAFQKQVADSQQKILQNATDINMQVSDASGKLKVLQQNLGDVKSGTQRLLGATKQVTDAVTGGDNYCYIRPIPEPPTNSAGATQIRLYIDNRGSTNCFDIHYQVIPAILPTDSNEVGFHKYAQVVTGELTIAHGHKEPRPDMGYMTPTNTLLPVGAYDAAIDERNGQVHEEFSWAWKDGRIHWLIKVTRSSDQKVLFDEHLN